MQIQEPAPQQGHQHRDHPDDLTAPRNLLPTVSSRNLVVHAAQEEALLRSQEEEEATLRGERLLLKVQESTERGGWTLGPGNGFYEVNKINEL